MYVASLAMVDFSCKSQEGGGGGYHCPCAAGHPKLASMLEIPAQGQVGQFCCFLLPVLAHSGQSACCPDLGIQRHQSSDSHFHLILGLPYTITINIPCSRQENATELGAQH